MNRASLNLRCFLAIAILSLFVGCTVEVGEPAIDTSSKAAYFASVKSMKKRLSQNEVAQLDDALKYLVRINATTRMPPGMREEASVPGQFGGPAMKALHDKTFAGVLELRRGIQLSEDRSRLGIVNGNVLELEKGETEYNKSKSILSSIMFSNPKFYWDEVSPGFFLPIINVVVTNKTGKSLSKLVLHGIITTADKSQPWVDAELRATVLGGLKNGETRQVKLQAPPYSEFARAPLKGRKDTAVALSVINAQDGENNYFAYNFFLDDQRQLERFRKEKQRLEQRIKKLEAEVNIAGRSR